MSLQLHRKDAALSGRVFTVGHCSVRRIRRLFFIAPPGRWGPVAAAQWTFGGIDSISENTGLVVGRTLVDPSGWRVPVLVSNFSQDTVMVEPFSEVGMIAQVSAIQPAMNETSHASCDPATLPEHLQDLLERTSGDLMTDSEASWRYPVAVCDLFPVPALP